MLNYWHRCFKMGRHHICQFPLGVEFNWWVNFAVITSFLVHPKSYKNASAFYTFYWFIMNWWKCKGTQLIIRSSKGWSFVVTLLFHFLFFAFITYRKTYLQWINLPPLCDHIYVCLSCFWPCIWNIRIRCWDAYNV